MHLLGSAEQAKSELYMTNYKIYSSEVVSCTEHTIAQAIVELSYGNITGPTLKNLVIKLHWFFLRFYHTNEPHMTLSTLYSIFSELVMPILMMNWNTTAVCVSHCPNSEDVNFGDTLIEVRN